MAHERYTVLPGWGTLLVSTDLHGNGADFRALREIFARRSADDPDTHWVILGDLVHAPDARARAQNPLLYDYPDESWAIVQGVIELHERFPERVHFVLGNHDHGHVGGPHTGKFYPDEVAQLESQLDSSQRAAMCDLFRSALLVVLAPCGVFLAHGSPDDRLRDPAQLDGLDLDETIGGSDIGSIASAILTSYGQPAAVTARLLDQISESVGFELSLVIHGHDRDEDGWFAEGGNQICPVIFGAPRRNKRYLELDLAARYRSIDEIRDGIELRHLY